MGTLLQSTLTYEGHRARTRKPAMAPVQKLRWHTAQAHLRMFLAAKHNDAARKASGSAVAS